MAASNNDFASFAVHDDYAAVADVFIDCLSKRHATNGDWTVC